MADKRFVYINKRGFTLIEVLFSLSICLLIVLNVLPIIKTVAYKDKITTNSSNYAIGAKQLAKILYTSKDIVVSDTLSFKDEKSNYILLHYIIIELLKNQDLILLSGMLRV